MRQLKILFLIIVLIGEKEGLKNMFTLHESGLNQKQSIRIQMVTGGKNSESENQ
jgi:hypothetical protein